MNSDRIFDQIERIADTSSSREKLAMLKEYIQNDDFRRVCFYAYHPHYVYGVRDVPERTVNLGIGQLTGADFAMLDEMREGELTGNDALSAIETTLCDLSVKSAELFSRIIRKDLRCGISKKTINKAYPELLPEFSYMRCCLPKDAKFEDFDWEGGCFSQEKADGMFVNMDVSKVDINMYGREGNPFNMKKFLPLLYEVTKRLLPKTGEGKAAYQFHGELLVERDGEILPREIANGLINSANRGDYEFAENERVLYKIWDRVASSSIRMKHGHLPYRIRFLNLCKQLRDTLDEYHPQLIGIVPTRIVHSLDEAKAHFREMVSQGKEGTVLKDGDAIWKNGTSKQQVKFKIEFDCDLEIVGFVEGQKATRNEGRVGSVTCQSADGKLKVDVAVKGEAMRDAIDGDRSAWLGKIMTVKANNIMPPTETNELYSLFLPRFVETEYRQDKSEADSLERIQDSFETAV